MNEQLCPSCQQLREFFNIERAADYVGVDERTIRRAIRKREIAHRLLGVDGTPVVHISATTTSTTRACSRAIFVAFTKAILWCSAQPSAHRDRMRGTW
jgi:hypothetical protein